MFYDKGLMNSEMLSSAWKLANNISTENVEASNLPNICNELGSWIDSDAGKARKRLSLRASSNLIGGAAKLYKQGIHKLFEDINQMDEEIIWRRKRRLTNNTTPSTSASDSSSESVASPEHMRRQAHVGFDSSISPPKKGRIESLVKMTSRLTMSRSTSKSISSDKEHSAQENFSNQSSDIDSSISLPKRGGFESLGKMTPRSTMSIPSSNCGSIGKEYSAQEDSSNRSFNSNSSISPPKRGRLRSQAKVSPRLSMNRSTSNSGSTDRNNFGHKHSKNCSDYHRFSASSSEFIPRNQLDSEINMENTVDQRNTEEQSNAEGQSNTEDQRNTADQRKCQGVQTSPINRTERVENLEDGFNTRLPFGYIIIHDTYRSRIPSKIIFTSINSDVNL